MRLHFPSNIRTCIEILKGLAINFPGLSKLAIRSTGGTVSARYCYSVWLRHLCMAYRNGLSVQPETVAELGPGDSLGIGLAALLTGADKYYAFDVVKYASNDKNIQILDELVQLFQKRENIPGEAEFPEIRPFLDSYEFPNNILTDECLNISLMEDRIESIRNALLNMGHSNEGEIQISYFAPWHDPKIIKNETIDLIFSQAVLEHVGDLSSTCRVLYHWLKLGGFMSHQVDFRCHGYAEEWNGHWEYSNFIWKLIKGNRPYEITREPHSALINYLRKSSFDIVCDIAYKDSSGIQRKNLASRFRDMSEDDITTSGAFIQSIKK